MAGGGRRGGPGRPSRHGQIAARRRASYAGHDCKVPALGVAGRQAASRSVVGNRSINSGFGNRAHIWDSHSLCYAHRCVMFHGSDPPRVCRRRSRKAGRDGIELGGTACRPQSPLTSLQKMDLGFALTLGIRIRCATRIGARCANRYSMDQTTRELIDVDPAGLGETAASWAERRAARNRR